MKHPLTLALCSFAVASCGDDTPSRDVLDASEVEVSDTADSADGDTVEEQPLLERAPLGTYACTFEVPVERVAEGDFRVAEVLAPDGPYPGVAVLQWPTIRAATIGADGALGAAVTLDAAEFAGFEAHAARRGDAIGVVWKHSRELGGEVVRFAGLDADDLTLAVGATDLSATAATSVRHPRLVPMADGHLLVFGTTGGDGASTLASLRLGPAGAQLAEAPRTLVSSTGRYGDFMADAIPLAAGAAVAYVDGAWDASEIYLQRLDANGAPLGERLRVSRPGGQGMASGTGYQSSGPSLLAVGDRLWVAFTETDTAPGDRFSQKSATVVRLAIVDGDEVRSIPLQAPVWDKNNLSPTLHAIGDQVGVLWTAGTIIYICGGCIADNDLKLALVDPTTLRPAGEVAVDLHETNGFVMPRAAWFTDAGRLVIGASLDFHALSFPAVGAASCAPTP